MSAQYFEYYTIKLGGGAFFRGHAVLQRLQHLFSSLSRSLLVCFVYNCVLMAKQWHID